MSSRAIIRLAVTATKGSGGSSRTLTRSRKTISVTWDRWGGGLGCAFAGRNAGLAAAVKPAPSGAASPSPSARCSAALPQSRLGSLMGSSCVHILFAASLPSSASSLTLAAGTPRNFSTGPSSASGVAAALSPIADAAASEAGPLSAFSPAEAAEAILAVDPTPMGWWPSNMMEAVFVMMHDATGLSWGLTIVATTATIRFFLFPVIVTQVGEKERVNSCRCRPLRSKASCHTKPDKKLNPKKANFLARRLECPISPAYLHLAGFPPPNPATDSLLQMKNVSRLAWIKDDMELITKQYKAHGGIRAPPQVLTEVTSLCLPTC